jgi:hypothetical protein
VPPQAQAQTHRTLLSANFAAAPTRALLTAGDRLRDLIVPDALASVVSAPAGWIPLPGRRAVVGEKDAARAERMRAELEEILASACPLCESVIAGLDRPFVKEGEVDTSWDL